MLYGGMNRFTKSRKEAHLEEGSELVSPVQKHAGSAVAIIHALLATRDQLTVTIHSLARPRRSQGLGLWIEIP
jgi:hypothetical protein